MAGVFLAFAISPVTNTRQFGIGLTVAVLLDATVVRLILLPALIKLFGERTWLVPTLAGPHPPPLPHPLSRATVARGRRRPPLAAERELSAT